MALIECAECGREISDKATACPSCGAPPEVFAQTPAVPDDLEADAGLPETAMQAATHADGRPLVYDQVSRSFDLGGTPVVLDDVWALDRQKQLDWTRLDVREVLKKAVKKGTPMGDLPVWKGPSAVDRFFEKIEEAAPSSPDTAAMVCPHCQAKGTVATKHVKQKKGVSGGKATAAVLTGGFSMLATGLSRKEKVTEAHCSNCGSTWYF